MQTGNCQSCTCFRPAMDSDQSRALAKGFCSLRGERSVDTYMAACPQFVAMGEEEPFSARELRLAPARHGRARELRLQGPQEDLVSELNRKLNKSVPLVRVRLTKERQVLTKEPIDGPEALAEVANRLIGDADREMMLCVHLSIKNHINSMEVIGIGAIDEVIAMPREIFKGAILY
jgi:RadC-like JAB domain